MNRARIYSPAVVHVEDTVIVTTNHLGASVQTPDGGPHGESGRDAQYMADVSGQRVVGLDRPHTGDGQHFSALQSLVMHNEPSYIYKSWLGMLKPALQETGATKIELVGKSIAASFLIEIAVLEELPVTGIVAVDPIALRKTNLMTAVLRYNKGSSPTRRAALRRKTLDIRQNREYILSDKATMTAALIAARMKLAKTLFAFADKQSAEDRVHLEQTIHSLNILRSKQNGFAPLLAYFAPGTSRSSFDRPDVYAAQYEKYRELGRTGDVFTQKIETINTDLV